MYYFIKGIISEKITEPTGYERIIIETNGVGFEVYTTQSAIELYGKKGELTTVYTALIHKEDQMVLYGFPTLLEKELFTLLFSVSGIGPKTALSLLNNLTVSEICYSIINEDSSILCKAQGIGEKTACRTILELKDKIKNWKLLPIIDLRSKTSSPSHISHLPSHILNEARLVLQSLGYSGSEINNAFNEAKTNGNQEDPESLVHFSLKWLSSIKR